MLRSSIPPSRASLDLHSTGRNSTCSVVRSEKCFSSIFLAESLILCISRDKTITSIIILIRFSLLCSHWNPPPYLTCWCSWWCGLGPSSVQCHAQRRRCVWFQVGCPQVLPPPRTPDGDVSRCWRLRTQEGMLLYSMLCANTVARLFFPATNLKQKPLYITKQTVLHVSYMIQIIRWVI